VSKIVWVRKDHQPDEVVLLEQLTGTPVVAATDRPSDSKYVSRAAALIIQLPIEGESVARLIDEAQGHTTPVPVVILDRQAELDESLINPLMVPFRHITDSLSIEQLASLIKIICEEAQTALRLAAATREPWCDLLVGESRSIRTLQAMIRLVGPRQSTVLITGESGVGKEMVARAIHLASKRAGTRMVSVNCAAIPENLVEAELFGHSKGAFTGAVNDRIGRFEQAQRGTILLDEIGDLPMTVQPKLLRVLQEREIQRVGGSSTIQVDARVIAASNANLNIAVAEKRFREDLLYRLNVVPIHVAPLRDRTEDIPILADHFIEKVCRREGLPPKHLSAEAVKRLCDYSWPGNVRQLEYAIEMAVTLSGDRQRLYLGDIQLPKMTPLNVAATAEFDGGSESVAEAAAGGGTFEQIMGRMEKRLLDEALRHCGGNKAKAANMLGIPRTTLVYKVKSLETCAV
jgi:two-component system nitrogen regulation response regulator GlnG